MRNLSFLLISFFILTSCAPQVKFLKYTEQNFEQTSEVEIFQTNPPKDEYIEMGVLSIRIKKQNEDDVIINLRKKAKEIGADAIIILGEKTEGTVAVPVGNMAYGVPIRDFRALAIK